MSLMQNCLKKLKMKRKNDLCGNKVVYKIKIDPL